MTTDKSTDSEANDSKEEKPEPKKVIPKKKEEKPAVELKGTPDEAIPKLPSKDKQEGKESFTSGDQISLL